MVTPAARRAWVAWVQEAYRLSEHRACRVTGVHRALIRYRARRPSQAPLRQRLRELAAARVSYGYLRLHVLLRRDGWPVNRKRIYRFYGAEGLQRRRTRPRRRRSAVVRGPFVRVSCFHASTSSGPPPPAVSDPTCDTESPPPHGPSAPLPIPPGPQWSAQS